MSTLALKAFLAVLGGFVNLALMAHLDRPLWELIASLFLPGLMLFGMDWVFDHIWPRDYRKEEK